MSSAVAAPAGTNNSRGERRAGKGRRRRAAAEQRRIEQQRWGEYVEDEEEDFSLMAPSPRVSRRRARRRNAAGDAREDSFDGLGYGDDDHLDPDLALALAISLSEQNSVTGQIGRPRPPVDISDMTYESLVQLESVCCVASAAVVAAMPISFFEKEEVAVSELSEVCVICQGEYDNGDSQVNLPCQHTFHEGCGAEWLLNYSKLCPVCKHDVMDVTTEATSTPSV